jgi:hypothetical protein
MLHFRSFDLIDAKNEGLIEPLRNPSIQLHGEPHPTLVDFIE